MSCDQYTMIPMERSPKGRDIGTLDGDPGSIITRGNEIRTLGDKMLTSATALENLVNDQGDQQGKAIEKVREIVGDTYQTLRQAGQLYQPVGPVLIDYGTALDDCQPKVNAAASAACDSWALYVGNDGGAAIASPGSDATDEQKAQFDKDVAAADAAKQSLLSNFHEDAAAFDTEYDTWETAFDAAVDGFTEAFDGKIKDGFWDNLDGFVSTVLKVLEIAGIILAIAGLIIGGPLIGLIGAAIAVVTLALTAYQVLRGDAGVGKLVMAIIGVIPVGKLGALAKGKAGFVEIGTEMVNVFRPSKWSSAASALGPMARNAQSAFRFAGGGATGLFDGGMAFWSTANPNGVMDMAARFAFGKSVDEYADMWQKAAGVAGGYEFDIWAPAAFEAGYNTVTSGKKLWDRVTGG